MALSNVRVDDLESLNLEPGWVDYDATGNPVDSDQRLLGHITIGNVNMHVEAIEVTYGEDGQEAVISELEESLAHIRVGVAAEGNFHTVEINGREYALIAFPFCT
jgi:hypothetical protein